MLLRTRVSLFVILAFLIICAGIAYAIVEREALIRSQYSDERVNDQSTLWRKIINELLLRMEDKAWFASENRELIEALRTGDHENIQRLGEDIARQLQEQGIADRLDVIYTNGSLAYSSNAALFQSPIISTTITRASVENNARIRGIGNDEQRNIAIVIGIPLRTDDGAVAGIGAYATDIGEALEEMERTIDASVFLVNRRGRRYADMESALWEELEPLVSLDETNSMQTLSAGGRVYSVVVLPQEAALGNLVGRIIGVKNVTELTLRQKQVSQITLAALSVILLIVLVGLHYYMSRAFAPLTEGVSVLNALSRGDLRVQIEEAGGRDEVGRIAGAVNVFRNNMISMDRFRRARARQRARQERFIRRQMSQLADTLDQEERASVLKELDQLEHLVSKAWEREEHAVRPKTGAGAADPDDQDNDSTSAAMHRESDSLAMMALAFQKMADRVQNQNNRLREMLATKDALIALQKELDIATRVQLSLLPEEMPATQAFEIAGVMKPAKEVGGDFYDFFRLDHNRIGLVVADVSGKGVPAALFMAMTRTLMRATAPHMDTPGQILASVNHFLQNNNEAEMFVTVFYGILDERSGRLSYASGGHDLPILRDSAGARPLATTDGALLAMFDDLDYTENHVDLEPGACLVLLTDGVTEAFNAELEAFGNDRLIKIVSDLPDVQPAKQDVADIITAVEDFSGGGIQHDDITCMVLRFRGGIQPPEPAKVAKAEEKTESRLH